MLVLAAIVAFGFSGAAMAEGMNGSSPPTQIGNIANGNDYQPTPSEVVPREEAAGIALPGEREKAISQDLDRMDADLLRSEGLSTKSVPKMMND
jgi:hypothetical protein